MEQEYNSQKIKLEKPSDMKASILLDKLAKQKQISTKTLNKDLKLESDTFSKNIQSI